MAADADAAGDELTLAKSAKHLGPDAMPETDKVSAEATASTEEVEKAAATEEVEAVADHDEAAEDGDQAEDADDGAQAEAADVAEEGAADDDARRAKSVRSWFTPLRLAAAVGLVVVLSLGGLVGWLGVRTYEMRQDQELRELFLRVGRQGAVNLTTIDWQNVNNDIQRILDSATGAFYEDFSKRSQPFIDIVKKVQSKSVGTVTEAGLESVSHNEARVLVAISVKTSNLGAEDQPLRSWRMRLDVQRVGDGAKISNVLFVPA
ncbi:Mce protein [Mycobacterium vicinigordonae]|uniref:Mce protein n=1 Tax=Mycobacterium vicinigordonae TaxID=1719132 RepID=A0A7D6IVU0_9MYCO|nr:Mce protein [Mycobacterium vicinigordonae]QLL09839.1 Mce protein [Mycobacterium vicinigordonae]